MENKFGIGMDEDDFDRGNETEVKGSEGRTNTFTDN